MALDDREAELDRGRRPGGPEDHIRAVAPDDLADAPGDVGLPRVDGGAGLEASPRPTSTTTPEGSWPSPALRPGSGGTQGPKPWVSEPRTPTRAILITASSGPGAGRSHASITMRAGSPSRARMLSVVLPVGLSVMSFS
nr:hypothetical protein [Actinomyces israelii]